jgi:hypothetical protein
MSVYAWAMAAEFKGKIAFNCLWPAHRHRHGRHPEHPGRRGRHEAMPQARDHGRCRLRHLQSPGQGLHRNFFIDDGCWRPRALPIFDKYAVSPGTAACPTSSCPAPARARPSPELVAVMGVSFWFGRCATGGWCWEKGRAPASEADGHKALCAPDLPGWQGC